MTGSLASLTAVLTARTQQTPTSSSSRSGIPTCQRTNTSRASGSCASARSPRRTLPTCTSSRIRAATTWSASPTPAATITFPSSRSAIRTMMIGVVSESSGRRRRSPPKARRRERRAENYGQGYRIRTPMSTTMRRRANMLSCASEMVRASPTPTGRYGRTASPRRRRMLAGSSSPTPMAPLIRLIQSSLMMMNWPTSARQLAVPSNTPCADAISKISMIRVSTSTYARTAPVEPAFVTHAPALALRN
mmetsp:Transcript_18245/g.43207  ORF Transcript_18245/g.43207 Transcript_18245/m.43207 type:complete len:248 (-) Transcript_18245:85-828(-)